MRLMTTKLSFEIKVVKGRLQANLGNESRDIAASCFWSVRASPTSQVVVLRSERLGDAQKMAEAPLLVWVVHKLDVFFFFLCKDAVLCEMGK